MVSTHYEVGSSFGGRKDTVLQYQMVVNRSVLYVYYMYILYIMYIILYHMVVNRSVPFMCRSAAALTRCGRSIACCC